MKIVHMPHATRVWDWLVSDPPHTTFRREVIEPVKVSVPIVDGIAAEVRLGVAMEDGEPVLLLSDNGADLRRMEFDQHGGPIAQLAAAREELARERLDARLERDRVRHERDAAEYARGWVGRVADPWA